MSSPSVRRSRWAGEDLVRGLRRDLRRRREAARATTGVHVDPRDLRTHRCKQELAEPERLLLVHGRDTRGPQALIDVDGLDVIRPAARLVAREIPAKRRGRVLCRVLPGLTALERQYEDASGLPRPRLGR